MIAKLLAEALGTFFLLLAVGLSALSDPERAPLAIGFTMMVMVYAGAHISGAHYNPAVTLAAWLRGALPGRDVASYWAAQFAGALTAAFLVFKLTGVPVWVGPGEGVSMAKVLVGEIAWTFALAYVVLSVATSRATEGNSYFGLAIGGTVLAGAFVMGPITGGAFNPAVGLAPALFSTLIGRAVPPEAWAYAAGPLTGAAAAALVFKRMNPDDA